MLFACVACCANAFAQIRTVTFAGRDRTNQYHIPLSRVNVFNLDQLWEEVLYYPDTVLILGTVGVEDYDSRQNVQLMQNVPNPFDGTTEFALQLPDGGDVFLEIYDITGKLAVAERFTALTVGTHLFQATLSSPQTYLLSAKVDNGKMTIKMVNEGHGAGNTIHHLGMTDKNGDFTLYLKNDKASSSYPFHLGDEMQYEGFALLDGTQWESAVVTQPQVYNDTVPLLFDVTVPTVQTSPVADITANTVVCGGNVTADGNSPVTARGVCWSTSHNPTVNDSLTTNSSGTGTFTSSVTGLTPNTTYYVRAYATNSVGTGYGEEQMFTTLCNVVNVSITGNTTINYGQSTTITASGANSYHWSTNATTSSITVSPTSNTTYTVTGTNSYGCTATASVTVTVNPILPTVATNNVSNIQSTTASCGGDVSSDGGASVTARGVCWSTSHNPTVNGSHTTNDSGTGTFTSSITGLNPNTTYYVRAYAINSVDTAYGEEQMFTTLCNVVNISITGNTTIYYGESTTLMASGANSYHWSTNANTSNITVNPTVTTSYTVTGTNNYGCTATASITVTVNPILPTVATNNVSNIQATTASCGGNVSSDGGASVTARGVCWSTSHNPTVNGSHTTNGSGTGTFTSSITGLNPNTTYYVRAYAINSVDTAYGEERMFTTLCNVVNVSITGNTTINYGQSTTITASGANSYHWSTNATTSSITVSPTSNTTYTVTGTNSYGCTATASVTVTVNPVLPTVATNNVSNIQSATALCGGNVSSHGGATVTARGVCWSTSQNPTVNDSHTTDDSGTGTFSSSITGLSPNTTYYVRAYATNSVGTAYGEERMFTTQCNVVNVSITGNTTINYGQSTTIMASGANSYHWSTNANTSSISVTPISTTTYTVTGTNSYGCTATASVTVTVNYLAPTVTTNNVTDVSQMSAICGGNVTFDGGKAVTARGVCWNSSPNPTVSNSHTEDGNGLGTFASSITGLNPNTTYYVRAYAINSVGTAYGVQKTFTTSCNTVTVSVSGNNIIDYGQSTTLTASGANSYRWNNNVTTTSITVSPTSTTTYTVTGTNSYGCTATASVTVTVNPIAPTVTTNMVSNIDSVSAICGGNVTSDGGATVTERGVCWSTSPNPTVNNGHTTNGTGIGSFISHITGLTVVTTYYVRAYAINSVDIAYGQQVEFTTANFACGSIIADYDGNTYNTVQIGGQCWMKENLRTAHYADGTPVEGYVQGNNVSSVPAYGYSYNWIATMNGASFSDATPSGVQGICPNGWHVPSNAEWSQLVDYVSSHSQYWCGNDSRNIAKALADTAGWSVSTNTCAVGNNPSTNNASGFSAMPAYATFWSASFFPESSGVKALCFSISYKDSTVVRGRSDFYNNNYHSVRCIRNEITSQYFPTVSTSPVSNITSTTASCGGNVTASEGVSVTARGVCWSLLPNPTIADKHTVVGGGAGSFTSNINGLVSNRTYFVRAYATNSFGTVYGNEVSVTTAVYPYGDSLSCPGVPTLTDVDGNVYNTVQIGGQCWMRENLRTTKYADGTVIAEGSDTSSIVSFRYYPDGISSLKQSYGLLYNWPAVMHESPSSDATPSGVQGVCPTGWHVPSKAEWTQFDNYVRSQSQYECICDTDLWYYGNYYAKALAATEGWVISRDADLCPCIAGNYDQSSNNATGFGALPAGGMVGTYEYGTRYWQFGYLAVFWSATEYSHNYSFVRDMDHINSSLYSDEYDKRGAYSVRCLRDEGQSQYFPTVSTNDVSNITTNTAICGGSVSSEGSAAVTARGVCWSTSPHPNVANSYTTDGGGSGVFSSTIIGLMPNLTYYVRAYATNSYGTVYGNEVSFIIPANPNGDALSCPGVPTLTDVDGNVYGTVKIGGQCWMRENLRTTKYSDGTTIPQGGSYFSTTAYWDYPKDDTMCKPNYGLLYNWYAVMHGSSSSSAIPSNVQGVCPTGWHVPSDAEWTQLTNYVKSQSQYWCGSDSNHIAKAFAASAGWYNSLGSYSPDTCEIGYNQHVNNATGFGALPAGTLYYTNGLKIFGYEAYFWSATENNSSDAYYRSLVYYSANNMSSGKYRKSNGFSVRCLSDVSFATSPAVQTDAVSNITNNTASCGGNVTDDGGATVTERGVCWSTSPNPTVSGSHTTDGGGTGAFSSSLTGLTPNTTYYVRAYATNSEGTAYGPEVSFTTIVIDSKSCSAAPTVTDHEGNVYATVQIGDQCWMRDNLRTTTSPSTGTYLIPPAGTGYTYTGKQARWYNNDSITYAPMNYGLLYNWNAAVDTFNTAYGETSVNSNSSNAVSVTFSGHRRGICPAGWHLPSDAEWNTMEATVSGSDWQTSYETSTWWRGNHAGKLAGGDNWSSSTTSGAPGDYGNADRNVSGFSAVPAGGCGSSFNSAGYYAGFWSSTQYDSYHAYTRNLSYYDASVGRIGGYEYNGYSVRCLRDGAGNPPNAPTGVSATLSGTQIQVSWNSVSNATSYKVYRSSSVNGSYTLIGSPTSNYYNDANPLTGYNYYKVKAVNSTGESAFSSVASCNYAAVSHTISISLITDRYGSDITWQVKDVSTNTILASGGPYSDLSSNGTTIQDIPTIYVDGTGCYVFIINDSYGDGLCCSRGNGSYSVSYDGVVIGSGGNAFSQETYYLNCPNVDEKSCPAAPTVTDHEGNMYATVQIGNQCWMRDNLRTTTSPSTGTYLIPATGTSYTCTGKQAFWYNNDSATYVPQNYGLLYNWNAAVDTFNTVYGETSVNTSYSNAVSVTFSGHRRGICPAGWHLPSDAEWTQLTNYVSSQSEYTCDSNSNYIAKALASTEGWNTYTGNCAVGNDSGANNSTGFSAVPAGSCGGSSFDGAGYYAYFWSSTQYDSYNAYYRALGYYSADVYRNYNAKGAGFSVRCLRD